MSENRDFIRETQEAILSPDSAQITEQQFQTRLLIQIAKLLAEIVQSQSSGEPQ